MGALMRRKDWSSTPVGPPEQWPTGLQTAIRFMLDAAQPTYIAWGPEYTQFYNDEYRPILGKKHPQALGQSAPECIPELWDHVGPMFDRVMAKGEPEHRVDQFYLMDRHGFLEETYFTFSYSAIRGDGGKPGGVLVSWMETTGRVLSERRLRCLRTLSARTKDTESPQEAPALLLDALSKHKADIPFAALYLLDESGNAERAATMGLEEPEHLGLVPDHFHSSRYEGPWPFRAAFEDHQAQIVTDLPARVGALPGGPPWPQPAERAVVLPIPDASGQATRGFLLAGTSPRLALNRPYQDFLQLVAGQAGNAIAKAENADEVRRRIESLAEVDRTKTAFFSNVSHEFRTPLTLMLGPIDAVLEDSKRPLPPDQRAQLEVAQRNARRLQRLVNTLLDFSRMEGGKANASYVETDLAAFTADIASNFRSLLERAGLSFTVDCAKPVHAFVDRELWEKIVLNLLSNAYKFTLEGSIRVAVAQQDGKARLLVEDTGIGIPDAEIPSLFKRFHRVKSTQGRSHEGTGIGLALVRDLVQLHGGQVRVESEEGKGSRFYVDLPLGKSHLPAERIDAARAAASTALHSEAFVAEAERWSNMDAHDASGQAVAMEASPVLPPHPNGEASVLVVDDNVDMRLYLARVLGEHWRVETAADGAEALETLQLLRPDLIMADVMMPNMDGVSLLRAIRANPELREIPVLLLSARAGEEAQVQGLTEGADDYLIKPFSAAHLVARVASHLNLAALRRRAMEKEREARNRAEQAEANLRSLLETVTDGYVSLDREGRIRFANAAAESLGTGSAAEWLGKTLDQVIPEFRSPPFKGLLREALEAQKPGEAEARFDRAHKWFEVRAFPSRQGAVVYFRDVTDRRLAQEELGRHRLQLESLVEERTRALIQSNQELEAFNSSVSHDLRTPLRAVDGYTQLALTRAERVPDPELRRLLRSVRFGTARMAQLIEDLLEFSRLARSEPENVEVDVTALCNDIVRELRQRDPERVVEVEVAPGLAAWADRRLLRVALANLLHNAWKFTQGVAAARIEVGPGAEPGGLLVRDNGAGFDMDHAHKLFQPFQRLHRRDEFEGTGIGLATVHRIVQRHEGRIWAESAPGQGATFHLVLPVRPVDVPLVQGTA